MSYEIANDEIGRVSQFNDFTGRFFGRLNHAHKSWPIKSMTSYSWTGSILASAYSRHGTARPILSSRDFRL